MRNRFDLRETDPLCPVAGCRQHPRAHEAVTNRVVARASAMSPLLSAALTGAIWGTAVARRHRNCGAVIRDSGQGADWLLDCACSPDPVAVAEHKPAVRAVANDTHCRAADYAKAVSAGLISYARPPAAGQIAAAHEQAHARRPDCHFCMGRRGRFRLVLPQVVVYALQHPGVPRVLVTDYPCADAAWAQYGWDEDIAISAQTMRVRQVPEVIDHLARAAAGPGVTPQEADALQVIASRLWWRSPWDRWEDGSATGPARNFVRDAGRCCQEHG